MKTSALFLILTILLSSCWVERKSSGNNNFSKRKHLRGHFWNSKGGNGNSTTNDIQSTEGGTIAETSQHLVRLDDRSEENDRGKEDDRDNHDEINELSIEEESLNISSTDEILETKQVTNDYYPPISTEIDLIIDDTVIVDSTTIYQDDWENYVMIHQPRCGFGTPIIFIGVMMYTGLFLLVLYLILAAFDIVLKWLLITGIIVAGFPIAALILIILFAGLLL